MRSGTRIAAAFTGYAAVAVAMTWPLLARLGSVVPHDVGDPLLNTWILWWNAHSLPLTAAWWNAPAFFPSAGALAFSEHLLALAPLTTPLQWLGVAPMAAYNTAFLLSFPLSALGMHALVHALTRRHDAALVAGLAFGFAPYRIAHLAHLQILWACWIPIALLALHRYADTRRPRWLAGFGLAWLMVALTNGYYLLFFSVLTGLWLLWFLPPWRAPRPFLTVVGAWVAAAVPLAPLLYGYKTTQLIYGMRRGAGEIEYFSADVAALLDASPLLAFWNTPAWAHRAEGELFPGLTVIVCVLALAAQAIGAWRAGAGAPGTADAASHALRVGRRVLWVVAAVGVVVAASFLLFGPWQIKVPGLSLSVSRVHKPLTFVFIPLVLLLLTSGPVRHASRRGSVVAFYLLAAGAMWLLALGPTPGIIGIGPIWYKAPYAWLMQLPGFDAVRVPARFAMMMVVCLSVVAGLAFARLAFADRRWRLALAAALAVGVLADGWPQTVPLLATPAPSVILNTEPTDLPVLELPSGDDIVQDVAAMYRSMGRVRPLVNGYSGYLPATHAILGLGLARQDPDLLLALAGRIGAYKVLIRAGEDAGGRWHRYVDDCGRAKKLREAGGETLYRIDPPEQQPQIAYGGPVPFRVVAVLPEPGDVRALADGNPDTIWTTPRMQAGDEQLTIELDAAQPVRGLRLALGSASIALPVHLVVEGSSDGQAWTLLWHGDTAATALGAAFDDPVRVPFTVPLGDATVRRLRVRQTGTDSKHAWSVAELQVLAPPAAR